MGAVGPCGGGGGREPRARGGWQDPEILPEPHPALPKHGYWAGPPQERAAPRGQSAGWKGSLLRKRLRCLQIPSDACGGSSYCGGAGGAGGRDSPHLAFSGARPAGFRSPGQALQAFPGS